MSRKRILALTILVAMIVLPIAVSSAAYVSSDFQNWLLHRESFRLLVSTYNETRPYLNVSNSERCVAHLKSEDIQFQVSPRPAEGACFVRNGISVTRVGLLDLPRPTIMTCSLGRSLLSWESNIQALSREAFDVNATELLHFGTYSCRSIANRPGILSEHAYANAIDVSGFRLSDGREISVQQGWAGDAKTSQFLQAVAESACHHFSVVLTPNSNRAHHDHFHLDDGLYQSLHCWLGIFR